MTNPRRSALVICVVATAAAAAAPATALAAPGGSISIKAPTCSKTAKASVRLTAKPSSNSAVLSMMVSSRSTPTTPGDFGVGWVYLPETSFTRKETVKVPVGTQLEVSAEFTDYTTSLEKRMKFKIAKCPKPNKPSYTG